MISVIVPCYNAEQYIGRCLKSIIEQTYKELEILVIDDGSIDNSAKIIEEYSKNDNRIKYLYQENDGVSSARNKGIENATGDLIAFVDADDTIKPDMYQTLVELMIEYGADISQCSYMRNENGEIKYIGNTEKIFLFEKEEITESLLEAKLIGPGVWNKLFKREIINEIRFDDKYRINEDYLFAFSVFQRAKKSVFIDSCFYVYHTTATSSCVRTPEVKKAEDCLNVSRIILEKSKGRIYENLANRRFIMNYLSLYRSYIYSQSSKEKEKARLARKIIKQYYKEGSYQGNAKKNAFLIIYLPFAYKPIYGVYNKFRKPNWDL